MDKPLLTPTKILLALWALVTIPGGVLLLFYEPFATTIVWPAPLEPIPLFHARLNGAIGLGTGLAALMALRQNHWSAARPMIGLYVAYALAAEYSAILRLLAGPVPLQVWLYVILGLLYLALSVYIWPRQTA